ncbi:6178_t:CDS:2 [Funneliformis geosporum]|uniref:11841_t:CDS:1 n=1 Tax=Funneliformis geosporum TaxID=1117311 RepID=A0A9W4WJW9_9GLOM|nr:6178_t:CDS:2 [Funneliformis geosporum]CAI2167356.1 11841_t:CDS:2 [Funneliformis geosporum]
MNRQWLFSGDDDEVILACIKEMERTGVVHGRYKRIETEFSSRFTAKQIRNHYLNALDPALCHCALKEEEKRFIKDWIRCNMTPDGKIKWQKLRLEMEKEFHCLKSDNKIKNYYYSNKRRLDKQRTSDLPTDDDVNTTFTSDEFEFDDDVTMTCAAPSPKDDFDDDVIMTCSGPSIDFDIMPSLELFSLKSMESSYNHNNNVMASITHTPFDHSLTLPSIYLDSKETCI